MKHAVLRGQLHTLLVSLLHHRTPTAHFSHRTWEQLFGLAERHGVGLLLFDQLRRSGLEFSSEFCKEREQRALLARLWHRKLVADLEQCCLQLESAGIPVVVLKGPALAERLYESPWLRPSTDLDLLVSRADLEGAIKTLKTLGYHEPNTRLERRLREHHHHVHLHRHGSVPLELHFEGHRGFATVLRAEELLARALPRTQGAGRILHPEHEAVYLAVHGASHMFVRALWLLDLAVLLRTTPPHWEAWKHFAARTGVLEVWYYTMDCLRTFEVELPQTPLMLRRRAAHSLRDWLAPEERTDLRVALGLYGFQALLADSVPRSAWWLTQTGLRLAQWRLESLVQPSNSGPYAD